MIIGSVNGSDVQLSTSVTPSLPRAVGDLCPGVSVTPDGAPATLDTHAFFTTADYGTACGYNGQGGFGWVDGVFTFTTTAPRQQHCTTTTATLHDVPLGCTHTVPSEHTRGAWDGRCGGA